MGSNPSPTLSFREATHDDVPALLPLIRIAYRGTSGWTTEAAYLNDKRISDDGLKAKIDNPNGVVLIVHNTDTGALVACCELQLKAAKESTPATAYFGLFAVDPTLQGGGVGRQVLTRAEEFAKGRWQAERIEMFVIWLREELISWYIRRGYERTGEKEPFPYADIYEGSALRDDLYFDVLRKSLA